MKEFMKDYAELCKETGKFYKKHWLGVVLVNVIPMAAFLAWCSRDSIKDTLEEKFHKEEAK